MIQLHETDSEKTVYQREYPRFPQLTGAAIAMLVLAAGGAVTYFMGHKDSTEIVYTKPVEQPSPPPIIVNVPEQPQAPSPNNDLGLTLEEYSNLSDPTDEMIQCLRNEGGKGCFEDNYRPTRPQQYYQQPRYYSANNSQAVSVMTGKTLPYWKPSSLPPIQGCPSREFVVKFGDRYYCGRRLIQ
ncbi:MAG: hypothetical protein WBA13_01260 [Microcoleaceae cyanobacterium]